MKSINLISLGQRTRVVLVSLLFTGVAACAPSRFSADGLCLAEAKALCHFQFQCCNASEREFFGHADSPYNDEASCNEVFTRSLCADANRTMGSVDADRAAWDEAKAEECYGKVLDAMDTCDAATVFTFEPKSDVCKTVVTGKVPNDGVCFEGYECATEGATCRNKSEDPNKPVDPSEPSQPTDPSKQVVTAEGTCVPPAALGEDCMKTSCAPDLYCAFDPMSETAKCASLKANGQACMGPNECQSGNCFPMDPSKQPTCGPKLADGQSCMFSDQCQSGYCDYSTQTCGSEKSETPTFDICTGKNE